MNTSENLESEVNSVGFQGFWDKWVINGCASVYVVLVSLFVFIKTAQVMPEGGLFADELIKSVGLFLGEPLFYFLGLLLTSLIFSIFIALAGGKGYLPYTIKILILSSIPSYLAQAFATKSLDVVAVVCSIWIIYQGVRYCHKTQPVRSVIFFVILPIIASYFLNFVAFAYESDWLNISIRGLM